MKRLMQDTVEVIKHIPAGEGVLVFVYKEKDGRDPEKVLNIELAKAGLEDREDLYIETWGNETSQNRFAHCNHVILVGILHRDLSDLAALYASQLVKFDTMVECETLKELCLSERSHCAYQALSRGIMRVMGEAGQASAMTGYIVEFEDGLEEELNKVLPGVTWRVWTPVYSDLVEHGKLVQHWCKLVSQYLCNLPATVLKFSGRKLRSDLQAEGVARKTWQLIVNRVLAENPQWIREDQWYMRSTSTV
jgi:hypothetical protein